MSLQINEEDATAKFTINMVGNTHRHTYLGEFKCKCILSPLEHIEADKMYRSLLGDNPIVASERAQNHAFALSQLKYRLIDPIPPFWATPVIQGNLDDDNIITFVLNKTFEAETKYIEMKNKEAKEIEERLTGKIKRKEIVPEEESEGAITKEQEEELEEEQAELDDNE